MRVICLLVEGARSRDGNARAVAISSSNSSVGWHGLQDCSKAEVAYVKVMDHWCVRSRSTFTSFF